MSANLTRPNIFIKCHGNTLQQKKYNCQFIKGNITFPTSFCNLLKTHEQNESCYSKVAWCSSCGSNTTTISANLNEKVSYQLLIGLKY